MSHTAEKKTITPGIWRWVQWGDKYLEISLKAGGDNIAEDDRLVVLCALGNGIDFYNEQDKRVIEMVPDLVDCLYRARRTVNYLLSCCPLNDITAQEREDAAVIRAAIDKMDAET